MRSIFIVVYLCYVILLLSTNVNSQQILLESTIVRCGHDEMLEDGTPKNPLQLASSFKVHPKVDLKLYSKCRKRLLITFRVTESSENFVPNALILIDRAKNVLTHKSSRFGIPIAVKFHQDALFQKYALKYLYRVNGKMYEDVVNSENSKNYTGCNENPDSVCGYVPGTNSKQVAGFCCSCKDHRNNVQQRGGQRCDMPNKTPQYLTSAHCMRQSQYWYNVYEMGSPSLYQKLNFEVFKSRQLKNGSITWHRMSENGNGVEVDSETSMNAGGVMKVTYRPHVEGVSRSSMVFDSSSQRLLFPLPNPDLVGEHSPDPEPLKGAIEDQILIVPKSLMSPHGATCDHIGTQISAFLNQPNPCQQERNACLNNQPFDLWKQDQGAHGDPKSRFRLKSYQVTHPPLIDLDGDFKTGSIYMEHYAEAPTYVDIEIPADEIPILSPGYNAYIESVLTDTGTEGAKIVTQVVNKELVEAAFTVELVHCSLNISQQEAEADEMKSSQKKIGPLHAKYFYLDIHSDAIKMPITCYVVLVNEYSEFVAAREVILHPHETCLCVHTCKCACGEKTNVECERLSDENIIAAGMSSAIKTPEQVEADTNSHFTQKYKWIFHWILVFHVCLLIVACCGWMRKLCRKSSDKKRGAADYDNVDATTIDEDENDDLDSTSGHSETSEVTLFDKKYTTNSKLLETELDSNLVDQSHIMSVAPSVNSAFNETQMPMPSASNYSISESANNSRGKVSFADPSKEPSMQASAINMGSTTPNEVSKVLSEPTTIKPSSNTSQKSNTSNKGPLDLESVRDTGTVSFKRTKSNMSQGTGATTDHYEDFREENIGQSIIGNGTVTSEHSQQYPQSNLSQSKTVPPSVTSERSHQANMSQSKTVPPSVTPERSHQSNMGQSKSVPPSVKSEVSHQANMSQSQNKTVSGYVSSEPSQLYQESNTSQSIIVPGSTSSERSQLQQTNLSKTGAGTVASEQSRQSNLSKSINAPASVTSGPSSRQNQKSNMSESKTGTRNVKSSDKSVQQSSVTPSTRGRAVEDSRSTQQKQSQMSQSATAQPQGPAQNQSKVNQSINGPEATVNSEMSIPNQSATTNLSKGHSTQQGPQATESSDFWFNNDVNSNAPIETFLNYCVSTSSSKTSFGTWHRKKRDQYSAYDFLPEPKYKGSNT